MKEDMIQQNEEIQKTARLAKKMEKKVIQLQKDLGKVENRHETNMKHQ